MGACDLSKLCSLWTAEPNARPLSVVLRRGREIALVHAPASCSIRCRAGCDERRCEYVRRGDGRLMTTRGWWGERPWNGAVSSVSR